MKKGSLFYEFLAFLKHNKKWWLLPIILVFAVFGLLAVFASGPAGAFLYTIF